MRANGGGFAQTELRDVVVTVGGTTSLDLTLSVSGASENITVTSEAPVVETTRTSMASVVNQRAIENLPVSGRNYLDFATSRRGLSATRRAVATSWSAPEGNTQYFRSMARTIQHLLRTGVRRTGVRPPYQFSERRCRSFKLTRMASRRNSDARAEPSSMSSRAPGRTSFTAGCLNTFATIPERQHADPQGAAAPARQPNVRPARRSISSAGASGVPSRRIALLLFHLRRAAPDFRTARAANFFTQRRHSGSPAPEADSLRRQSRPGRLLAKAM